MTSLVELNANGTGQTYNYDANGNLLNYSVTSLSSVHDGFQTDNYTAANVLTSDSWTAADGSSGTDVFNADDSIASSTLVAGSGLTTLVGGAGNDTFTVNNAGDVVQAQATASNTIETSVSYTASANVQTLTGTGGAAIALTGNGLADTITSNSGDDTLVAGTGLETLVGGSGGDTFVVDNTGDVVTAQASTNNTIQTSVSYTAASNVQILTGTGSGAIALTGNALGDVITANAGNDTLTGGAGNDTLIGGSGTNTLDGKGGNNTYEVALTGTSNTLIYDTGAVGLAAANQPQDTLVLPAGVTASNLTYRLIADSQYDGRSLLEIYDGQAQVAVVYSASTGPAQAAVGVQNIELNGTVLTLNQFMQQVQRVYDAPVEGLPIVAPSAIKNTAYTFALPANAFTTPDGDALTLTAVQVNANGTTSALPSWLSFNAATGTFSGTPAAANVGTVNLEVIATDGGGLTATSAFALNVANADVAPVVTAATVQTLLVGQTVAASSLISVSDAQDHSITSYQFQDTSATNGYFVLNGVAQVATRLITVTAANLATLSFVASSTPGTGAIYAWASDGQLLSAGAGFTVNSWLHKTDSAPVVTAESGQIVLAGQSVAASSLISVSDADGDPITTYQFDAPSAANGYFELNGVAQAAGTNIDVTAANLANLTFVGSSTPGTGQIYVWASDGQLWSAAASFTVNTWLHATNSAPVVTAASGQTILVGQSVAASSLISVSDADDDPITTYQFSDTTAANGHFVLNGVVQAAGTTITVSAANLANLTFVGSSTPGTGEIYAWASDGMTLSNPAIFWVNVQQSVTGSSAPVVTTPGAQTVLLGQSVAASSLFAASDASGNAITSYRFYDASSGGGHFALNGVAQANATYITVSAANLANVTYVGGSAPGTDTVLVYASDGQTWSSTGRTSINSWYTLTDSAPVVTTPATQTVLIGQSVAASSLFTASDPDGNPILFYRFYDGSPGDGYFALNGVAQPNATFITVSAANLANLTYVGGNTPGSDMIYVLASDGETWSNQAITYVNSWLQPTDSAPVVTTPSVQTVLLGQSVAASSLFSVSDVDGNPIVSYRFYDSSPGDGHFALNGVAQANATYITVSAADLANLTYVGGTTVGTDKLQIAASDGEIWSSAATPIIDSSSSPMTSSPVVTAPSGQSVLLGQSVAAGSLFNVSDALNNPIVTYALYEASGGAGNLTVNGVQQATNTEIDLTAAQLAATQFVAGTADGTAQLYARAFDGSSWGSWSSFNVASTDTVSLGSGQYAFNSNSGSTETLILSSVASADQLWFQQSGQDLLVDVLGSTESIDMHNWFVSAGPNTTTTKLELSSGPSVTDAGIQKLVQAMAAFAAPTSSQSSYTPQEQAALAPVIAANWH